MSGWDARQWANVIHTGIYVLVGLALLLWRPAAGRSWWSWQRLFGAAIIILALLVLFVGPLPTRSGLISNAIFPIGLGLWFLLRDLWSVNGPDLPAGTLLRQRFKLSAGFILYGGINIALGLTLPK